MYYWHREHGDVKCNILVQAIKEQLLIQVKFSLSPTKGLMALPCTYYLNVHNCGMLDCLCIFKSLCYFRYVFFIRLYLLNIVIFRKF